MGNEQSIGEENTEEITVNDVEEQINHLSPEEVNL